MGGNVCLSLCSHLVPASTFGTQVHVFITYRCVHASQNLNILETDIMMCTLSVWKGSGHCDYSKALFQGGFFRSRKISLVTLSWLLNYNPQGLQRLLFYGSVCEFRSCNSKVAFPNISTQ